MFKSVLQLITKYCKHLKEITLNFGLISNKTIKEFGIKCSQKLTKIGFYDTISTNK